MKAALVALISLMIPPYEERLTDLMTVAHVTALSAVIPVMAPNETFLRRHRQ